MLGKPVRDGEEIQGSSVELDQVAVNVKYFKNTTGLQDSHEDSWLQQCGEFSGLGQLSSEFDQSARTQRVTEFQQFF